MTTTPAPVPCAGGGYSLPGVRLFLGESLLPEPAALARLLEVAATPRVQPPVVVLPDVHVKEKVYIPSGVCVALRGAVAPALLGPPNDAMLLAVTDLREEDLPGARVDALFDSLRAQLAMFRRRDPVCGEDEVFDLLQHGVRHAAERWGFAPGVLERIDDGGCAHPGEPPARDAILAAFPRPGARPPALPDFVPHVDLVEAAVRALGTLDGGSHFAELDVVDSVLDPTSGVCEGQVAVALHCGAGDVGLLAHRHWLRSPGAGVEVLPADSASALGFLTAYRAAASFAYANRLFTLARVRDALCEASSRPVRMDVVSDVPHDHLDTLPGEGGGLFLHRKGAVRTIPQRPIYFPSTLGGIAHVLLGDGGQPESYHTCSHGVGRRIHRDEAVARYDAAGVEASLGGMRLYRFGVTDFASQAPASYKDLDAVLDAIQDCGLARPAARLRPLAVLKG